MFSSLPFEKDCGVVERCRCMWCGLWIAKGSCCGDPMCEAASYNPIFTNNGKWYFYIETWCDSMGPFNTHEVAKSQLEAYNKFLETGDMQQCYHCCRFISCTRETISESIHVWVCDNFSCQATLLQDRYICNEECCPNCGELNKNCYCFTGVKDNGYFK